MPQKNRPSPSQSATKFNVGTKKKGNDGNFWVVKSASNGVKRWSKITVTQAKKKQKPKASSSKKTGKSKYYYIHDNGGRPLMVEDHGGSLTVWKRTEHVEKETPKYFQEKMFSFSYKKLFIPKPSTKKWDLGNTLLAQVADKQYIFIGNFGVQSFKTKEPIEFFMSHIGNSDVPYPYALTENYALMFANFEILKKSEFPEKTQWHFDIYEEFYSSTPFTLKKITGLKTHIDREGDRQTKLTGFNKKIKNWEQVICKPKKLPQAAFAKKEPQKGGSLHDEWSEISLLGPKGNDHLLSSFLGKPLLIVFYKEDYTVESVFQLDTLNEIYKELGGSKKINFLAIPLNNDPGNKFMEELKLKFKTYADMSGYVFRYFKATPKTMTLVFNSEGKRVKKWTGFKRSQKKEMLDFLKKQIK